MIFRKNTSNEANKKQMFNQKLKAAGPDYAFDGAEYLGGHPDIPQTRQGLITINKAGLFFSTMLPFSCFIIPIENIKKAEFKTEEQIHKDVTLGRLLLFGVFAFGMKKKTKTQKNYLVVIYEENGIENIVIFEAQKAGALASAIARARQEYIKENPAAEIKDTPAVIDIPEQIRKLAELKEQGIITQEEFEVKKKELLSKM